MPAVVDKSRTLTYILSAGSEGRMDGLLMNSSFAGLKVNIG